MNEIIFLIEETAEGDYTARALDAAIFTEADSLAALREAVRDAVRCHFEPENRPQLIRLHFAHDEVFAV